MSKRVKTVATTAGILLGCVVLATLIRIVGAEREEVGRVVQVEFAHDLGEGRYLVKEIPPQEPAETLTIEAITRYPGGLSVVETAADGIRRPPKKPVAVRTKTLRPGPVKRSIVAFGTATPERDVLVAVETAGVVSRVHVRLGSRVAAGAPLVELQDTERQVALRRAGAEERRARAALARLRLEIAANEEQLAIARQGVATRKRDLDRWQLLTDKGVASGTSERDQADIQWRAARSEEARIHGALVTRRASLREAQAVAAQAAEAVAAARIELRRCVVRAPFAGQVQRAPELVQEGAYLRPGTPVVRLVAQGHVRLRVHVRGEEALSIPRGAAATVTIPELDLLRLPSYAGAGGARPRSFPARVLGVAPAGDPRSRKFAVDLRVENPAGVVRGGMFGRALLPGGALENACLVPDAAILSDEERDYVYAVEDDVARRLEVTLGPRQGEARIALGIAREVEVVTDGTALLFDGAPIVRLPAE